jgi:hypothetical protein
MAASAPISGSATSRRLAWPRAFVGSGLSAERSKQNHFAAFAYGAVMPGFVSGLHWL